METRMHTSVNDTSPDEHDVHGAPDAGGGSMSGRALILAVEDRYNRASSRTLQRNPFWVAMVGDVATIPDTVFYGMCIENYQLLCRESYFDAPVLSFPGSAEVRRLLNDFYASEIGHDRILLEALRSIGVTDDALERSVALHTTMALCNALSTWARHDPLFFLTTLGPLEGRDVAVDSFVLAAEAKGLPEAFVEPIRRHAHINRDAAHGLLTRQIFEAIPAVGGRDAARILAQTELFIAIYDRFYTGVWNHYRDADAKSILTLVP